MSDEFEDALSRIESMTDEERAALYEEKPWLELMEKQQNRVLNYVFNMLAISLFPEKTRVENGVIHPMLSPTEREAILLAAGEVAVVISRYGWQLMFDDDGQYEGMVTFESSE